MRREMTHLLATEDEAKDALDRAMHAMLLFPPMWPVTDIRVERRLSGKGGEYKWVVAGDYSGWP